MWASARVRGVDYEGLSHPQRQALAHRFEAALRLLDEHCRVYQYLLKRTVGPSVAAACQPPIVANEAIQRRAAHGTVAGRSSTTLALSGPALRSPARRTAEHRVAALLAGATSGAAGDGSPARKRCSWSNRSWIGPWGRCTTRRRRSRCRSASLGSHVSAKQDAFRFFRQLVNYAPAVVDAACLTHDTHLDYFVSDSAIDCHRDHLRRRPRRQGVLDEGAAQPDVRVSAAGPVRDPGRVRRLPRMAAHPQRSDAAGCPESPPALLQQTRIDRELRLAGDAARGDAGRRFRERDGPSAW